MPIKTSCEVTLETQLDVDFSFSPGVAASYSDPGDDPEIEVEKITAYILRSHYDLATHKILWEKVAIPDLTPQQIAFFAQLEVTLNECASEGEIAYIEGSDHE